MVKAIHLKEEELNLLERKPKLRNYISYGVGDFLGGGSFIIIGALFMFFMTEIVGMSPFYAGLLVLIGRLWDAISDPLMGYISDRTRSRFGRRRIFFLYGIIPVFLSFSLLWVPVNIGNDVLLFFWYLLLFLFFSTTYTIMMVPYIALNAEISLDYKTRAKFSGFKQLSSGFSGAVCLIASRPIIAMFPDDQAYLGYMAMGIIYGLFFSLPWIAVFFGTWELPRNLGEVERQTYRDVFKDFLSVFRNKSFRIHIGMYMFAFAAMDIIMAMFLYFLSHYIMKPELFPKLMVFFVIAQAISLPLYIKIGNTFGKGQAYLTGAVILLAGLVTVSLLNPYSPLIILIIGAALIGAGLCGATTMPWVILPSITDVDEMITTKKRAGIYSGMMTFFRKTVSAVAIFTVGTMLSIIGFVPSAESQTAETINSLRLFFFLGPCIVMIGGIFFGLKFKITPKTHYILRAELQRLENGGAKESVDEETRHVCEMLTGFDYEKLYQKKV